MKLKLITILLFFVYCTETIEPADCNGATGGNSVEDIEVPLNSTIIFDFLSSLLINSI